MVEKNTDMVLTMHEEESFKNLPLQQKKNNAYTQTKPYPNKNKEEQKEKLESSNRQQ